VTGVLEDEFVAAAHRDRRRPLTTRRIVHGELVSECCRPPMKRSTRCIARRQIPFG
jgi:hypothetical protein